jgi:hypothetical protein
LTKGEENEKMFLGELRASQPGRKSGTHCGGQPLEGKEFAKNTFFGKKSSDCFDWS